MLEVCVTIGRLPMATGQVNGVDRIRVGRSEREDDPWLFEW